MGSLKLSNNAQSTLAGAITDTDTLLSVQVGDGGKFPSLTTGDWFPLTLVDASNNMEIVRCTARTGDVFTITRAQEGTAARAWSSGDSVGLRFTAAAIQTLIPNGASLLAGNNLSDLTNTVSARSNLGLGDASTHPASDFATAAQGGKADTALQPFAGQSSSAAKVASTGAYGDLSGVPDVTVYAKRSNNLSDLGSASAARSNLGLGTAATLNAGTGAGNVVQLDGSGRLPAVNGSLLTNLPYAAPSSDVFPVGTWAYCTVSVTISNGASVAGSNLRLVYLNASGDVTGGTVQTGTWQNVAGVAFSTGGTPGWAGCFVRTA